jgi:prepilin-type N-terminal cleavage/methylation domain-containing protein
MDSITTESKKCQGFTLVEILVVLLVICILAAILFPLLTSVRRNVHLTACASNLHQVAVGLHLYQQDWNRLPPDIRTLTQPTVPSLTALKHYVNDESILQCPYSEIPHPHPYFYQVGPGNSVLNPESGTVVAYCIAHLDYSESGGLTFSHDTSGRYFPGTYIVVHMDGSTARVNGRNTVRWQFFNGQWSPEEKYSPVGSYVMVRFPKEAWPPHFE